MSDEMSPEELYEYVVRKEADQPLGASLEQELMRRLLDPTRLKTTRTVLMGVADGVISESLEGTRINEAGILEEIQQNSFFMLDDGTSTSPNGITRCQNCNGTVAQSSLRRCPCGKTCCVRQGCGHSADGLLETLYCSGWHSFFAWLGLGVR